MNPLQANILAMSNCIKRAGLAPPTSYEAAIAWAASTWVNRLEVQAEALRLIGIEVDPELYQDALDRAKHQDAIDSPNRNN